MKITPHHVRITPHVVCVRKEYVTLQDSVFNVIVLMDSTAYCVLIVSLTLIFVTTSEEWHKSILRNDKTYRIPGKHSKYFAVDTKGITYLTHMSVHFGTLDQWLLY